MDIITNSAEGDIQIVTVFGSIDGLTAGDLQNFFDDQIAQGKAQLVFDLSEVDFLSSAGLRTLVTVAKNARQTGGDLRLTHGQDNVQKVITMAGFDSIFKLYPTSDEAVASFTAE